MILLWSRNFASGWIKWHLNPRTSTCGKFSKCLNVKHLVIVPVAPCGSLIAVISSSNMVLDTVLFCTYLCFFRLRRMSTPTVAQSTNKGAPAAVVHGTAKRDAILLILAFAAVYLIWGSTYLAIAVGIESFPTLLLPATRHLTAGLILYPVLRWKTGIRPTPGQWRTAIITGLLLLLVGNGGVCLAERTVPSGVAALLVALVSFWMVLLDWLRPAGLNPAPRVVASLVLGFGGLVLLVGPAHLGGSERVHPAGAGILVIGSFAWAWGSIYSKHHDLPSSPLLGVAMQSLAGGTALWMVGLLSGEGRQLHLAAISARSWIALAYLIVFGSGIGFTAYVYLLKKSSAARVGTYAFVNPVVALFLGWLGAGETITLRTALAAVVILTAVLLVISAPRKNPIEAAEVLPNPGEA
jgi:drug/metabolite transporter (DMT)-like permease